MPAVKAIEARMDVAGISDFLAAIKRHVTIEWGPEVFFYQRRELIAPRLDSNLLP